MVVAQGRTLAGIGGISASILLVQLAFARILSVTTWYHFAFLAISLALLGLAAGGVVLHLTPWFHRSERLHARLVVYAVMFSFATVALAAVLLWTPLSYLAFRQGLVPLLQLLLLGTAPFFFGGLCLGLVISILHEQVGPVYAADLIGAACGCLLFIPLMRYMGGGGVLLAGALLGTLAALLFGWEQRGLLLPTPLMFSGLLTVILAMQGTNGFFDVRYPKSIEPVPAPLFAEWNMLSRVTVHAARAFDTPGLGRICGEPKVEALELNIDSSAATPIFIADTIADIGHLECAITAMGYVVAPDQPKSLVIGPGGGRDVWTALAFDSSEVVGVEINGLIAREVQSALEGQVNSVYSRDRVTLHVADGRSFVRGTEDQFDIIQASVVDTWAATSAGAFALSENTLYTVEAFVDYVSHLTSNGILSLSRWEGVETMRLVSVAQAAAEELGWPGIEDRIFIAAAPSGAEGVGDLANLVLKRSPLTNAEIGALSEFAEANEFEILYAPGGGVPPYQDLVSSNDPSSVVAELPFDISPVTDDRPFFFQTARIGDFASFLRGAVAPGPQDGLLVVVRLVVVTSLMVLLFLVGPLWLKRRHSEQVVGLPVGILSYFALLGTGFMLLEIGLMQRFILFLGHPSYSLTVILFTLLLGAGLGSRLSRNSTNRRVAIYACATAAAIGLVYAFGLPSVFKWGLGWPIQSRIALAFALLLPLGLVLGIPFPTGVRAVGSRQPEVLAWSWAINGATSVLGSVLAILLAMTIGFRVVILVGATAYLIAMIVARYVTRGVTPQRVTTVERHATEPTLLQREPST